MRILFVMLLIVLLTPLIIKGCSEDEDKKADEINQLTQDAAEK